MKIRRDIFFSDIRQSIFKGRLGQNHVDGMELIIETFERLSAGQWPVEWLAYILATAYHETAHTFKPVREYGRGRGKRYGRPDPNTGHVYYGRGFVQLTWKANYAGMGDKLGVDLVNHPDKALAPDISALILIKGMVEGDFTGKALSHYIEPGRADFRNARRVVNGTDKAALIAGYAQEFLRALKASRDATNHAPVAAPPVTGKPAYKSTTNFAAIGGAVLNGVTALGALDWKVAVPIVLIGAAAAIWIIRERRLKSLEGF